MDRSRSGERILPVFFEAGKTRPAMVCYAFWVNAAVFSLAALALPFWDLPENQGGFGTFEAGLLGIAAYLAVAGLGLWRRQRWGILLSGLFFAVVAAAGIVFLPPVFHQAKVDWLRVLFHAVLTLGGSLWVAHFWRLWRRGIS